MGAQTQIFDDGSSLTYDDLGTISSTAATDRVTTTNGSTGSPEWTSAWQNAARSVLGVGTDYARARLGLSNQTPPVQAGARPAGAINTVAGQTNLVLIGLVGVAALLLFKKAG